MKKKTKKSPLKSRKPMPNKPPKVMASKKDKDRYSRKKVRTKDMVIDDD